MLFSSLTFIFLFLPVVLAVYYLAPLKIRNLLLLLASLIFYAWGEPVYVVLMILSILLNYCCGREIAANAEDERKAHRGMIYTVVVNLALLFFFKYYGFFLETRQFRDFKRNLLAANWLCRWGFLSILFRAFPMWWMSIGEKQRHRGVF